MSKCERCYFKEELKSDNAPCSECIEYCNFREREEKKKEIGITQEWINDFLDKQTPDWRWEQILYENKRKEGEDW